MKQCPNCGAQAQDDWTVCPSCFINMQQAASLLGRDYYVPPEETGQAVPNITTPVVVETNLIMTDRDTIEEDGGQIISDTTDPARMIFFDLLHRHPGVQSDPKRFGALIGDYYRGAYRKEMTVLIDSLREGIPEILLKGSENTPYSIQAPNLARRLVLNWGFNDDLAAWAVDTWALGLGLIKDSDMNRSVPSALNQVDEKQIFFEYIAQEYGEFKQIIADFFTAYDSATTTDEYSKSLVLAMNMSTQAQFWHNKIADLPIPSDMEESKTLFLQYISERQATGVAYAKAMQHHLDYMGLMKEVKKHMTWETQYITKGNQHNDKYITVKNQIFYETISLAFPENKQIWSEINTATTANDFSRAQALAIYSSHRAQFWHDKIGDLHVLPNLQESKIAFLLALSEDRAQGDVYAKALQHLMNYRDLMEEGNQHCNKATNYLQMIRHSAVDIYLSIS